MTSDKIVNQSQALDIVTKWKKDGHQVVFTNGCFDIVHLGHIDYLEKAQALGNKLVLGLNTDASVARLKGPNRPIVQEYARARMMAAFSFVDLVVLFDEATPLQLIQKLLPNVLVKGNDYSLETIVGATEVIAAGGQVATIALVPGYSTTAIVQKIKEM
jgi:D-glycero-beta-D-manno-heptose 1-phosphate adenylyltransferase